MSVPGLECIFNPEGTHGHPFSGLETQYRQMKYYKQYFEVVVSFCITVYIYYWLLTGIFWGGGGEFARLSLPLGCCFNVGCKVHLTNPSIVHDYI